jgi:hypothetical protein
MQGGEDWHALTGWLSDLIEAFAPRAGGGSP